jgi:hypothetical protein
MSRAGGPLRHVGGRRSTERRNVEEYAVKYMLLIYNNPATYEAWSEDERAAMFAEVESIMADLAKSGELVGGAGLVEAPRGRIVRVRQGMPAVTDGPFAEAKEQLAGYLTVECDTPERAVEIAASWPDARYFAMEVREVVATVGPAGAE